VNGAGPASLDALRARHPEWASWLRACRVAQDASRDLAWAAAVPAEPPGHGPDVPLATGATFALDTRASRPFLAALLDAAGARPLDAGAGLVYLDAAVALDGDRVTTVADAAGAAGDLLAALAPLAAMPLMQACARAWSGRVPPAWAHAACPVCGAWAALMEARGIERVLRLRCGRCGADWTAEPVRCPYCGERDHDKLGALVGGATDGTQRVETCTTCLGYVKTVTTLTACAPADVGVLDLATVALDVAALEQGYTRPPRPAFALGTRVIARPAAGWRALLGRPA
jgi:FdhE protein